MSIELINTLSHTLTDHELSEAINTLCDARRNRQLDQLGEMKNTLIRGDRVEWYSTRHKRVLYGHVEKTKTKKAIVRQEGKSVNWDIPMGMLKKVRVVNE